MRCTWVFEAVVCERAISGGRTKGWARGHGLTLNLNLAG